MPNRTQSPDIQEISKLILPKPQVVHLDNGIPIYITNLGTQAIVKMEIVFYAGRPYESKQLVARTAATLLKEGTKSYNSAEYSLQNH